MKPGVAAKIFHWKGISATRRWSFRALQTFMSETRYHSGEMLQPWLSFLHTVFQCLHFFFWLFIISQPVASIKSDFNSVNFYSPVSQQMSSQGSLPNRCFSQCLLEFYKPFPVGLGARFTRCRDNPSQLHQSSNIAVISSCMPALMPQYSHIMHSKETQSGTKIWFTVPPVHQHKMVLENHRHWFWIKHSFEAKFLIVSHSHCFCALFCLSYTRFVSV